MKTRSMRIAAAALAVCMGVTPVMAATVANATIDEGATGSLTIHKYDTTAATIDGITTSPTSTGKTDATVETAYTGYEVDGVEFTYVKVADITTYTETQSTGVDKVQVAYAIESSNALLNLLSLGQNDSIKEIKDRDATTYYYASDTLINALDAFENADMNNAKNKLEAYVTNNGGTAMPLTGANGNAKGVTSADELDLGLYMVVETKVPEQVTDTVKPFFVSLPMTENDGDEWNYDVVVYPKNESGMPTLEKLVAEKTNAGLADDLKAAAHTENDQAYAPTATASDGDILWYQVTSKLPIINSEATYLTTYTFVDTLSKGIEYTPNDVILTWYSDEACTNKVATWKVDDSQPKFTVAYGSAADDATTMTISMTPAGLTEINTKNDQDTATNYGQHYVRISYAATVNKSLDVVYGDNGNPNDVVLTWKRTSMDYYDTLKDECIVYSYALDLAKQFSDNKGNFANVSFKIQNQTDGYYLKAIEDAQIKGQYYVDGEDCKAADETAATAFVPNPQTGSLKIYGLEDDTYIITELTTDDGYTLLKDAITVVINTQTTAKDFAQNDAACADGHANGVTYDDYMQVSKNAIRTAAATVDANAVTMKESDGSVNAIVPMTVVNSHSFEIPKTGDSGNFILPVAGMAAAGILLVTVVKMRMKDENAA